jgi:hypothetical protein
MAGITESTSSGQSYLAKHSPAERQSFEDYAACFERSPLPTKVKLRAFAKYVRRQDLSRFLARNELFKLQLDVPGSIIECGTYTGQGLMTYSQLSSIYEPYNHTRKVIGFDTFAGFPEVSTKDRNRQSDWAKGDLSTCGDIQQEIGIGIALHDANRPLNHLAKTLLVAGDATRTIPEFVQGNPHLVCSMLYLDVDLYEPTKVALEQLVPRMPKGAVLAFDELNAEVFPGETQALQETLGIRNVALRKTPFDPYIAYALV